MTELRTCYHESAHGVVAYALRRPIRLVSVRPGETFLGVMVHGRSAPLDTSGFRPELPAIVQPAKVRRSIEGEICISLAGSMGGDLVWQGSGYVATPPDEVAAKTTALEFAGLSRSDAEHLAALERDPTPLTFDEENASQAAWALAGAEAAGLLSYLRATTRAIVAAHRDHIAALAEELQAHDVLSGRRVRELLKSRGVKQWH